jgi:acyl-CoA synthetase (AMP-forming)/AMP-acid ligase II
VLEAAAFTVPDDHGSKLIQAAVTTRGTEVVDGAEILRHARGLLPVYAVPREIAVVTDFPRTSSGKIDRKRLAADHSPGADL